MMMAPPSPLHTDMLDIFSPYIISLILGYVVTELIKTFLLVIKQRKFCWREFFKSGGMPSSHSAVVAALATTVGLLDGFGSPMFGIAAGVAAIVMYDAMHVRRAVGEQGQVISKILEYDPKLQQEAGKSLKRGESGNSPKRLYFSRGHRGVEVFVGGIVGVIIGLIVAILSI